LPALFRQHAAAYKTTREAYVNVWKVVEPTLSPHNRTFASNIELLRKSKDDSRIDAALRGVVNGFSDSFNRDLCDKVPAELHSDDEDPLGTLKEDLTTETLIAAYNSVALSWRKESLITGRRIPALLSGAT
jgi:hypothetical protein